MSLIIWLVVGGLIGWLASRVMKTDAQQGVILNVVVGIVGALLGGWLLSPLLGAATVNQGDFSLLGLLVSFGGAIILLVVVNLVRRRHEQAATGRRHAVARCARKAGRSCACSR
jgi:uncharacterized membrane protein YeaQ/YmgE (transglycosylase-associated protein family)